MSQTKIFSRRAPSETSRLRGERRRAGAGGDDLDLADLLARQLQRIGDGRRDDDRSAVLVVVEDRYAHAGLGLFLDLETFRALDVLQVDAAESRLQRDDNVDELVDVVLRDLDVEHVDAGELLEQYRLALHHRLGGERADRAKAQHRRAVGQHRHEVLADRQIGGFRGISGDRLAGESDAGGIGEREIALVAERLGRLDLQLARARLAMEMQGVGFKIVMGFARHEAQLPVQVGRRHWPEGEGDRKEEIPLACGRTEAPIPPADLMG